jgi:hypothetical protein
MQLFGGIMANPDQVGGRLSERFDQQEKMQTHSDPTQKSSNLAGRKDRG